VSNATIKEEGDFADWISQSEAARLRGVSRQAIAKLVRRRRLSAQAIGGRMLVLKSEVEAFVPLPLGRPAKKEISKNDSRKQID
jgi:excisionase family DNA binding protein